MKKKVHKIIPTIRVGKSTTQGTACKIENKIEFYKSAHAWELVDCKKCLELKKENR